LKPRYLGSETRDSGEGWIENGVNGVKRFSQFLLSC